MNPNDNQKQKETAFDCFCKKVVKNEAMDIHREIKRRNEKEISLDQIPLKELENLAVYPKYSFEFTIFNITGLHILIEDESLANALQQLSEEKRNIILLSYFIGLNDRELSEHLHVLRRTLSYRRNSILKEIRKTMEGFTNE